MEPNFQEVLTTIGIVAGITGPVIGGVIGWLKNKFKCIDKVDKRSFRQSKAIIILANRLDDINQDQHGKDLNLGAEVEEILKDQYGNL